MSHRGSALEPADRLFGVFALLVATQLACTQPDPEHLASYRGGEVTVSELEAALRELPDAQRRREEGESLEAWLERLIAGVALEEVLVDRAQQAGLGDDEGLGLKARVAAAQEAAGRFVSERCPAVEIPEAELIEAQRQQSSSQAREWILLRHIYKRAASPAKRATARAGIDAVLEQVAQGASFIELARQHSDSATAKDGGLIGRISRRAPLEPAVLEAAWALEDGATSGIIEVSNGFHILLRQESGREEPRSLEEARRELERNLIARQRQACAEELVTRLAGERPPAWQRLAAPGSPDDVIFEIGSEAFTRSRLSGLVPGPEPSAPAPFQLQQVYRALLVADRALAEGVVSTGDFEAAVERHRRRMVRDRQWAQERREWAAARPVAELRGYFEEHSERFHTELVLDAGLIVLRHEGPGRRVLFEQAQELRRRLAAESFEELARGASAHASASDGGRLGPMPAAGLRAVLGAEGATRAAELAPGEVSEPLLIQGPPRAAYALVKVFERREPRARDFDAVRELVVDALARERVYEVNRELRDQHLEQARFRVHQPAVEAYAAQLGG